MNPQLAAKGPVARLLLLAVRAGRDPEAPAALRRLCEKEVLEWGHVVQVAARHRLLPILSRAILDHAADCVDAKTLATLRGLYLANTREGGRRLDQMLQVLDTFSQAGIRAVPLKGPALAQMAYQDVGLRMSADVDIMVSRADVPAAIRELHARGYELRPGVDQRQMGTILRSGCEIWFVASGGRIPVELHWLIVPPMLGCRLDVQRIESQARPASLLGRLVTWPSSEHLFVMLCVHGAKHHWAQLEAVHAVAELVAESPGLDWAFIRSEARSLGSLRRCRLGGVLAADLLEAPVPEDFLREARSDAGVGRLAARVRDAMLSADRYALPSLEDIRWNAATLDSLGSRARYLLLRALPPSAEDWTWARLPRWLYPLYYVLRPIRLLVKYSRLPAAGGAARG